MTGQPSTEWVDDFYDIVNAVDTKWARNPPEIPVGLPKITKNEQLLSEGTKVRVKLEDPISVLGQKLHGKFRTGDIKWDPRIRIIKKLILSPDQPPTYLLDGPHGRLKVSRCAYTKKQLQVVGNNERPPPDTVVRGNPRYYIPERILNQRVRRVRGRNRLEYLIKWKHYPEDKSTWEPADNIQEDAPGLINIFNQASSS